MVQNKGDFTTKESLAVMKYLFLKGNSSKKKNARYSTVEHSSTEGERSGRPTHVTIPETWMQFIP
jgi:hypothetical protein